MTPEQLKASILQYAFQGKLVEQICTEENADLLFDKIIENRRNLVKKGLANKAKNLPDISENEKPYDIPESWVWVRLNDIVFNHGQKTPDNTFSYIDIGSIDNIHQKLNKEESLIEADKAPSRARKIVKIGDIIYSTVRPYLHNTCIIDKKFEREPIASTGFAVLACCEGIYNKFLFYYLLAPVFDSYANAIDNAKGVAYPAINDDKLYRAIVPLPPLKEQHRIVAKIEELLPFVDRYAEAYDKLEKFNAKFPEDLKKSILQYAIQGKLVEQRAEEGSAEELYKQIQEEKQKLIREGKIKKEKTLAEITEDEIPFDIPENWKWVRISDVVDVRDGTHDTPGYIPVGYPLITGKDFYNGFFELSKTKYISEEDYSEINKRSKVDIGDILFSMIGGNIGSMISINAENYFEMAIKNVALFKQYNYENSISSYLEIFLRSQVVNFQSIARGGAQSFVSLNLLRNYLFPLPPFEEQKRIVAKIEELLPYCNQLMEKY